MHTSSCRRLAAALLLALSVLASPALAADPAGRMAICDNDQLPAAERLTACSALIDDAATPPAERLEALMNRGELHGDAQDNDRAIADLSAALVIDPKLGAAHILRGNAYDAKGDLDKALADYEQAIRLDPNDAVGYFNRAEVFLAKGDLERARHDYAKALEIDPGYEGARQGLAELQARK